MSENPKILREQRKQGFFCFLVFITKKITHENQFYRKSLDLYPHFFNKTNISYKGVDKYN